MLRLVADRAIDVDHAAAPAWCARRICVIVSAAVDTEDTTSLYDAIHDVWIAVPAAIVTDETSGTLQDLEQALWGEIGFPSTVRHRDELLGVYSH